MLQSKKKKTKKNPAKNHLIPSITEARHFQKEYFLLVPGRQQIGTLPEVRAGLGTAWGLNARGSNTGRISVPGACLHLATKPESVLLRMCFASSSLLDSLVT